MLSLNVECTWPWVYWWHLKAHTCTQTHNTNRCKLYIHTHTHTQIKQVHVAHSGPHKNTGVCFMHGHMHAHTVCTNKSPNSHPCYFCSFRINLMDRMSGGITTDWWDQDTKCSTERDTLHCITQEISAHRHTHTHTWIYKNSYCNITLTCTQAHMHSERRILLCILTICIAYTSRLFHGNLQEQYWESEEV